MQKFSYEIDMTADKQYPLGITMLEDGICVSVVAAGDTCSLVLLAKEQEETIPFPRESRQGDVWTMILRGDRLAGLRYGFLVDGVWMPDPYGRMFSGREQWGDVEQAKQRLYSVLEDSSFDWEGDKPPGIPYEASTVYRIHPRGFTRHRSSGVAKKGTFRAIMEKLPYLKELGITTVEMLPVAEFQEVMVPEYPLGHPFLPEKPAGKLIYWGYTSTNYFAAKASYSSGRKKEPVTEFKELVKEFHRNQIEVVIELYFSGKESPSFVLDVVRFWVQNYHVDGIHLVGEVPLAILAGDPYLAAVKLWATGWDNLPKGRVRHLAEYNDGFLVDMRRVLKGDEDQLNRLIFRSRKNPEDCGVINYIANTNGFTLMDMVSYDVKHNEANGENNQDGTDYNYSWNCGVEGPTRKKQIRQMRKKQIRNALLLVFLSQGTPLLLAGDEFGKSQSGNNNTYCQDNEISWLNWNQKETNQDIFQFVKHIITFRRQHPVFSGSREPRNLDYQACGYPDVSYHGVRTWSPEFETFRRQLGILYCGEYRKKEDQSPDDYFYVAYNMHWESHEFFLPNLPKGRSWRVAINTDAQEVNGYYPVGDEPLVKNQKRLLVLPRTIIVLIGY